MTPKDIRVRLVTVGDASGARTVAQELRAAGQAAENAATVTISAAGRATAALRTQADAARRTATSSSGPGLTIRAPGNSPDAAAAAVGVTQSGNSGPPPVQVQFTQRQAQASRDAAQAAQQRAQATQQAAAAERQSTTATAASTTAVSTNTTAATAAATAARTKAQAIAALAAARVRDTAALGAHTTALIVAARVIQSVTTALSANTIARGANAAAARSGTTAYAAATRAAQIETAAVAANTTAANANAAARIKAAASGNNVVANTQATAANTTAAAANAAAQAKAAGSNTQLTGAQTASTQAHASNTTAVATNTRALQAATAARGPLTAATAALTTASATSARAVASETTALAANTVAANANAAAKAKASAATTATAAATVATNTNTTAASANAAAAAAATAAKAGLTAALAASTTAIAVNSRALAAGTATATAHVASQNALKTSLSATTVAFNTNRLAAAADTHALAANSAAFRTNALAVNAAAAARRNATAAAGAAKAAANAAASNAKNTTGVSANTAALAANTAAMSPNVTARNKVTLTTVRNTTAVAANTAALQTNILLVGGHTAATNSNNAAKALQATLVGAHTGTLAGNSRSLGMNTGLLNQNTNARGRNSNAGRQGAAATNQFGLAMMQAAYFVDDLQYGLRGFVNNIPLLLTSMGLGGGLAGAISILAVGIKVLIDHWHLFSDELSAAGKTAQKATADMRSTAGAAHRAAADADLARAAWKRHTDAVEGAVKSYDRLRKKIEEASGAQKEMNRRAMEKDEALAALDIAEIEARQAEGNISETEAIVQKREVYRGLEKKKFDMEQQELHQQERDAIELSRGLEEKRMKLAADNRRMNLSSEGMLTSEERKALEEDVKYFNQRVAEQLKQMEEIGPRKFELEKFGEETPLSWDNPFALAGIKRVPDPRYYKIRDEVIPPLADAAVVAQRKLDADTDLRTATNLKGLEERERMNKEFEEAMEKLDEEEREIRKPLNENPIKRKDAEEVYGITTRESDRKSGTEITKVQDTLNQERQKEFDENQKSAQQDAEEKKKQDAALVEDVLDRLRDRANADKQSGAFDRSKARNVTGRGGRRGDRLAGIGEQSRDKERLVNDVIKSAEAIRDGVDGGEVQTLFAALQRLGAALDKRDADYVKFGREMLDLARKLEAQQKNLRK